MTRVSGGFVTGCALLSLLLPAGPARAQGLDVTGSWSVQMQTVAKGAAGGAVTGGCGFQGTTNVNQTGSQFTGGIDVTQTSGTGCPPAMSANLSGTVSGNQVSMGAVMGSPSFGAATFTGTLTSAATRGRSAESGASTSPAVNPGSTMSGTFAVTSGPFTGTGGTWTATSLAAVAAVPAVGARGLALLAALLLGCSLWLLRRTSIHRAP
ncbi:MAG TPA: hypothetical protein VMW75_20470 [Thermoanaerobaculia bacterium]|nr:hypothetical protein [Thermoanaerobaculia bacterium]